MVKFGFGSYNVSWRKLSFQWVKLVVTFYGSRYILNVIVLKPNQLSRTPFHHIKPLLKRAFKKSHSHVDKQTVGAKCPNKRMASGAFCVTGTVIKALAAY